MAISKTLITSAEVKTYSPEGSSFPLSAIEPHIRRVEVNFARQWLGWDFYQLLVADAYDLGSIADYVQGTSYDTGDMVQCYGIVYTSLSDSNMAAITDTDNWQKLESKMKTSAYAELYEYFLRDYLAYIISADALEYANPVTGQGVVEQDNGEVKTASLQRQQSREKKTKRLADDTLRNMAFWMLEQKYRNNVTAYDKALIISSCDRVVAPYQRPKRIALQTLPYQKDLEYFRVTLDSVEYSFVRYQQYFERTTSRVLTWTQNSGNLFDMYLKGVVSVFQNGNKLIASDHFVVSDVLNGNDQIRINENTHFVGANYEVTAIIIEQ